MSLSLWISSRFGTSVGQMVTSLSRKWLIGGALLSLSACRGGAKGAGMRVGLITPGSVADAAWNSGAYQGLTWIHDSLGLSVSHVEARTPAEQDEALRAYAAQGYALVFATGSSSRMRPSGSRRSIPPPPSSSRPGAGFTAELRP